MYSTFLFYKLYHCDHAIRAQRTRRHILHGVTITNLSSFCLLTARSFPMLRLTVKARSYTIAKKENPKKEKGVSVVNK
jgi:hypothetical protein